MEADRDSVVRSERDVIKPERTAWRGGSVESHVTLGGRQVGLPRLRMRDAAKGEVPLASFQWAAATATPLEAHTLEAIAAGVSTRQYPRTLDPVPADVTERSTSRSAVSRRFVALSTERLRAFVSRPLGELDLRVVCIDGKVFKEHCIVVALGIDTQGRKPRARPARRCATETAAVSSGATQRPGDARVAVRPDDAVPDRRGRKRLRRAISDIYGSLGIVQRCQFHKYRNVLGHLPERMHASVGRALRTAWDLHSEKRARNGLSNAWPARSRTSTSRRRGVDPRGAGRDADGAAGGTDGTVAADTAHDEHHREPQRRGGALHAEREAVARRTDDPALGGERATGGRTALPTHPGLP